MLGGMVTIFLGHADNHLRHPWAPLHFPASVAETVSELRNSNERSRWLSHDDLRG